MPSKHPRIPRSKRTLRPAQRYETGELVRIQARRSLRRKIEVPGVFCVIVPNAGTVLPAMLDVRRVIERDGKKVLGREMTIDSPVERIGRWDGDPAELTWHGMVPTPLPPLPIPPKRKKQQDPKTETLKAKEVTR